MNVAVVIERFGSRAGGVEAQAFGLVRELARREVDVTAVCRAQLEAPPPGAKLARVRAPAFWQPLRLAAFSRGAARATARGFDVVHSYSRTRHQDVYRAGGGSHAAYLERVHARPALRARLSPRHRAILAIEEAVFRDARQRVQCPSAFVAADLATRYGVDETRLAVVRNGVDVDRFRPAAPGRRAALRAELGLDRPVALFAGTGFQRKGLDRAIDALARAGVDALLLVAGAGDPARPRAQAERLGVADRVRFLGARRDLDAVYAAADLLVLPTRYDPFANACLEALAAGLPVATTPANGASELIEPGVNGLVLEDDFAPAFAWLEDAGKLESAGRAARRTAERYTWECHGDAALELYAEVRG